MGWSNGPPTWAELERVLSGRPGRTDPEAMYPGDGGDSPAWSRKRGEYLAEPVRPVEGPTVPYAELHAHSAYSFLDGASQPEELVEEVQLLEDQEVDIGVVTQVQGLRWFDVTFTGMEGHAGTVPMTQRRDAMMGAARLMERVYDIAIAHAPNAVGTVGALKVHPGSRNVIPGLVEVAVDLRSPSSEALAEMEVKLQTGATLIAASGRPRNCTSHFPVDSAALYNGAAYWFCGRSGSGTAPGTPGYVAPSADYRISPRGSYGEMPWSIQLNLNVAYEPRWAEGLTLQADIINVLNRQTPGAYNPRYETATRNQPNQFFNQEIQTSTPRYLRLSARYDF